MYVVSPFSTACKMAVNVQDSPFTLAYKGDFQSLKVKLTENNKLLTQLDDNERMLIHWAALGGHEEIVRALLDSGSPVDPGDDIKMTPLILAASAGREKVVHILISRGAQINAQNEQGHSAYAASKGMERESNMFQGELCLIISSLQFEFTLKHVQVVKMLLANHADVNITDKRGATPLHRAASKGNTDIVKLLLEQGNQLRIDPRDAYGNTPLHLACEENRVEEAKLLVMQGAKLDMKNKEERTPVDLAPPSLARQLRNLTEQ